MHKSSQLSRYCAPSSDSSIGFVSWQFYGGWVGGWMVSVSCSYNFFQRNTWLVGKAWVYQLFILGHPVFQGNTPSPQPSSSKISHSFPPLGKPLVKTSRGTVINTEEPAITVDVGSTIKTVKGVNVTINCQVAGEKCIRVLIHLFKY